MSHRMTFVVIGVEQWVAGTAPEVHREFPREILRVLHPRVHPLPARGTVHVRGVPGEQHPAVTISLDLALVDPEVTEPVRLGRRPLERGSRVEHALDVGEGRLRRLLVATPEIRDDPPSARPDWKHRDHASAIELDPDLRWIGRLLDRDVGDQPAMVERRARERKIECLPDRRVTTVTGEKPVRLDRLHAPGAFDADGPTGGRGDETEQAGATLHPDVVFRERLDQEPFRRRLRDEDAGRKGGLADPLLGEVDRRDRPPVTHDPRRSNRNMIPEETLERNESVDRLQGPTPDHQRLRQIGGPVVRVDDPGAKTVRREFKRRGQSDRTGSTHEDGRVVVHRPAPGRRGSRNHSTRIGSRISAPSISFRESPSSVRADAASAVIRATISGCRSATSFSSPGSSTRSKRAGPIFTP